MITKSYARTELAGNHVDYQNGITISAPIDLCMKAEFEKSYDSSIEVTSDLFGSFRMKSDDTTQRDTENGTMNALIRGVVDWFKNHGVSVGGFRAVVKSEIPPGFGLSSSAAFENLIGNIINQLFADNLFNSIDIAFAGKYAENKYYGKGCGLQDQIASSANGIVCIDFEESTPIIKNINYDIEDSGYDMLLINSGKSHEDLTQEFQNIVTDYRNVANFFGVGSLREIKKIKIFKNMDDLRSYVGDRAVLRSMHYLDEIERVKSQYEALKHWDFKTFLELVRESGRSSWELLQNVIKPESTRCQDLALTIATVYHLIGNNGAVRVHGGGFAGSVQAYTPRKNTSRIISEINNIFCKDCCTKVSIKKPSRFNNQEENDFE